MDGSTGSGISLDDKYAADEGRIYLTGVQAVQALVRLPMEQRRAAGLSTAGFVSGYRGSPLGTYDRELWAAKRFLDKNDIVFQPGLNEDLAATSAWGSQQVGLLPGAARDGGFAIWSAKSPAVDRSGDALKHANAAGTGPGGGVLAIAGDDHACKSAIAIGLCVSRPVHSCVPLRKRLRGSSLRCDRLDDVARHGSLGWHESARRYRRPPARDQGVWACEDGLGEAGVRAPRHLARSLAWRYACANRRGIGIAMAVRPQ